MRATELLANQLQPIHDRLAGLAGLSREEWLARPAPGEPRVGFLAWHIAATRDWAVRPMLQAKRPLGWDAPFAGTSVASCEIPFGMSEAEADAIADRTTPEEVIAYSAAVTDELLRWLASADDAALAVPPPNVREHLALTPRYDEHGYREELELGAEDMTKWPVWKLLTRPCFSHCVGHLTEIAVARTLLARL